MLTLPIYPKDNGAPRLLTITVHGISKYDGEVEALYLTLSNENVSFNVKITKEKHQPLFNALLKDIKLKGSFPQELKEKAPVNLLIQHVTTYQDNYIIQHMEIRQLYWYGLPGTPIYESKSYLPNTII